MVSVFTPNINLEEPARGDQVGVWDTPVNSNMTLTDLVVGGITTISLNNAPIVLSAAQFQAAAITFNSTLTGNVAITFSSTFKKGYKIRNICTGSSAFVITLGTTVAGGQVICCPPGESIDCVNDGTNLYFHNLERVGSYWDYAGSSVPGWVSGCTVPPYLNCDGSVFSATTYPQLATILGSTTLPNSKGRSRFTLDQGAGLISTAVFSGTGIAAVGGAQTTTLSSRHLPQMIDPTHQHPASLGVGVGVNGNVATGGTPIIGVQGDGAPHTIPAIATGITYGSSSQIGTPVMPPAYIGGLTLIRAA